MLRGKFVKVSTLLLLVSLSCFQYSLHAGTFTWTGGGADANLSTTANWNPVAGALGNDDLIFAGSIQTSPNNSAAVTYNSLSFAAGANPFTLGGSAITLSSGINNLSGNLQTINAPITLAIGNHVVSTAGAGIGGLTFGTVLTRSAGSTAEFDLGGTITLTGATSTNGVLSSGGLAFASANGTDWASLSGNTVAALASYQTSTDPTNWLAANNVSLSANPLAGLGDTTINTLRLSGNSAININNGNTLTLSAGGLLVTGNGTNSISGGTLKGAGGTTKELVVIQNDTANPFTIASVIADNGAATALTKTGLGTLNLNGTNTYTGANFLAQGSVVVGPSGNLGANTNALTLGTTAATGASSAASLTLNNNITVGSLTVGSNTATPNTIAINGSSVMTVTGTTTIGFTANTATQPITSLTITGNELDANGTFTVGAASNGARSANVLNMAGLSTFKLNSAANNFNIGTSAQSGNTVTLANTLNQITVAQLIMSNTTSNAGTCTLNLGAGVNTINASTIILGQGKGNGNFQFVSGAPSTASVTIAGTTGGSSTANITIANQTSATSGGTTTFDVTGHQATVQAGTVIVGQLAGATGGTPVGNLRFDTGTFTATNLQIANDSSGTAANGIAGTVTIGGSAPNNTATGVFNVTSAFSLANATNTNATSTVAKGTFIMNGGTANIGADILVNKAATSTATTSTTLTLAGGNLNMNGHAIAPISATTLAINTINLPAANQSATLSNLGGTGINGAGLTMGSAGTLFLGGSNTFTGGTSINSGTLAGTGSISGAVTLNSGNLSSGAAIGAATGTLTLAGGLITNGGNLLFNLGSNTSNQINVTGGGVSFGGTGLVFQVVGTPTSGNTFTLLSSNSPLAAGGLNLAPQTVGRTIVTPSISGNSLIAVTSGGPAGLIWNNAGGSPADGQTWDVQTTPAGSANQNWSSAVANGGTGGSGGSDYFFQNDAVTFNDNNNSVNNPNAYNVNLSGSLQPGAVVVNNGAGDYTFSIGGTIDGTTGLTKQGSGKLTISGGNNGYSGVTTISGGVLSVTTLANGGVNSSIGSAGVAASNLIIDSGTLQWTGSSAQSSNRGITVTQNGATLNASPTASVGLTLSGVLTMSGNGPRTLTLTGTDPNPTAISGQTLSSVVANGTGGPTTVIKNGNNGWVLSALNTYTGGTSINAGRIRATNAGAFGTGNVTIADGAAAYLNTGAIFVNNFSIAGIGIQEGTTDHYGALRLGSTNAVVSGSVTLTGDARITARGATASTISGQITGTHALELGNSGGTAGTLTLTNLNNNWTGDTTISSGTVKIGAASTASSGVIPHGAGSGNVVMNGDLVNSINSTLDLNGFALIVNGLSSVTADATSREVVTNNAGGAATLSFGDNGASSQYDGSIQAGGAGSGVLNITKIGNGVQTLSGSSNTYTGSSNVNGGTLKLLSTASISTSSAISVASAGTLDVTDFNAGGGFTVPSGQSLVASGAVNGTINLNGTVAGTSTGNIGGIVNTFSGSQINPGASAADGNIGTLKIGTLNVNGGDFRVEGTAGNVSDLVSVSGVATFNSGATVTVVPSTPAGVYTILTAQSLSGANGNLSLTSTSLNRFAYSLNFTQPNKVLLNVVGGPASLVWNNNGGANPPADGSSWDVQGNNNWTSSATTGNPNQFYQGDSVTFNDSNSGNYTVNLTATVNPASITVSNFSGDYVFNNSGGSISGTASLVKNGSRAVTLAANNTYTGGTTLNQGTLNINSASALGTGALTINGGTIDNTSGSALTMTANNPQVWANSFSFTGAADASHDLNLGSGAVTLNGTPTVTVAAGTLTLSGSIGNGTGNGFTKAGAGTLVLNGASSYTGNTTISGGTVKIGSAVSTQLGSLTGGSVTVSNGATLDVSGNPTSNNLNFGTKQFFIAGAGAGASPTGALFNNGGISQQNAFQKVTLTADASVGGTGTGSTGRMDIRAGQSGGVNVAALDLAGHTLTKTGPSQFTLVATTVSSTGGTPGAIVVAAGELGIETTSIVQPADVSSITMGQDTRLEFFGNTAAISTVTSPINVLGTGVSIGAGNSGPIIGSPVTLQQDVTFVPFATNAASPNSNFTLTMTGVISDGSSSHGIVKNGVNTVILSGANTYTGNTTVTAGTLQQGAANALPSASNLVLAGGTLSTGGFNGAMNKLTVQTAATPSAIDLGAGASVLNFNASSLVAWTAPLTINNWTSGTDHIFFGASSLSGPGLTHAQLNSIQFTGTGTGAILQGGELVPNAGAALLNIVQGDFNLDGQPTSADVGAMLSALTDLRGYESTKQISDGDLLTLGDFDHSGSITNGDIQGMLDYIGGLGTGSVAAVPEPATLLLAAFGLVGIAGVQFRRRSAKNR